MMIRGGPKKGETTKPLLPDTYDPKSNAVTQALRERRQKYMAKRSIPDTPPPRGADSD